MPTKAFNRDFADSDQATSDRAIRNETQKLRPI